MIGPDELKAVQRFADKVRMSFPIPEGNDFVSNIKRITYEYVWDILALREKEFELEFEVYAQDLERSAI